MKSNRRRNSGRSRDDYEFLDNIDFLKHIDFTTKEGSVRYVHRPEEKDVDAIEVQTDFLEDFAFFDELDYFDELNRSLERELKELDSKLVTPSYEHAGRWYHKRSSLALLTTGVLLVVVIGTLGLTTSFAPLKTKNVSYASEDREVLTPMTNPQLDKLLSTYEPVSENGSSTDIPKVKETTRPEVVPSPAVVATPVVTSTSKPDNEETPKATTSWGNMENISVKNPGKYFKNSVFVGNSLTVGLQLSSGLRDSTFLAAKSLTVSSALDKKVIRSGSSGQFITILEGLNKRTYDNVYLMFGINELGWAYSSVFVEQYRVFVEEIKKVQPEANIYIQSILPVSKARSDTDQIYNNNKIKEYNQLLEKLAKDQGVIYLDVSSAVKNQEGVLPEDATSDGIHLKKPYCMKWLAYIMEHSK